MPLHPDFMRVYLEDQLAESDGPTIWLPFCGDGVLVEQTEGGLRLIEDSPARSKQYMHANPLTLGVVNGTTYRTCEITEEHLDSKNQRISPVDIRKLFGEVSQTEWLIAGYAAQILHWRRTSGFCPICGMAMGELQKEWMRRCTVCGHERYPQVCPALLILVHDGEDRILMAHKPGWGDRYSIFAGFVLPGESLEECVHREVLEEAGVVVSSLEYVGSQPWPFPHQLMIGFKALYKSGEIAIDQEELDDARWFTSDTMPMLPGALSLSRQMIEGWLRERSAS